MISIHGSHTLQPDVNLNAAFSGNLSETGRAYKRDQTWISTQRCMQTLVLNGLCCLITERSVRGATQEVEIDDLARHDLRPHPNKDTHNEYSAPLRFAQNVFTASVVLYLST